jgi:LacI family transcriptional regulator
MAGQVPRVRPDGVPTPNMEDVARAAGVSLGTVSNVINGRDSVTEANRVKVERAIQALGYVRNRAARYLAGGSSNTIGFVLIDLSNSFFLDMARGAEDEAQQSGMAVVLANTNMQPERQGVYLNLFEEEQVGGILIAPLADSMAQVQTIRARGPKIVVLNDPTGGSDLCHVLVDNELGSYLAARHLIDSGRRALLFAGGPERFGPVRERHRGVQRAVAETNGPVTLEVLAGEELQVPDGRRLGHVIAGRPRSRRPDGIIAVADLLAVGILQSLMAESDIRVPDDLSMVGYDNNRSAWDSIVPISTVAQPGAEMGAVATQLLLEELRSPGDHQHRRITLEPALIVRESSQR